MDSYSKYRGLAVRINCIDYGGSGCMFQPFTAEYSYVITAKHCLEGTDETPQTFEKTDIEIFSHIRETKLTVIDYYLHPEYDLAIIKVEYINGIPGILITIPRENKNVGLYGYPNLLDEDEETAKMGQYLDCKTYFNYSNEKLIEFRSNTPISNRINSVNKTLGGFSGSGIFYESNNNIYLMGIFTEIKEVEGAFDALLGYDISAVNEILLENQLHLLIPEELLNFERYINTAFDSNEGIIKPILKRNARPLLDLKPNDIVRSHNERLYLPYNSFIEEELLNPKLWEGWVSLLTYYYMDTSNLPNTENFKLLRSDGNYDHNIRMYFTSHKKISSCIMDLFVYNYDDLDANDLIVINTKNSNPASKSFNKDKTKRVLRNIDRGERERLIEDGIDIDDPEKLKNVQFIHIDLFSDRFSEYEEIDNQSELEEKLKESIKEVFNNVP